MERIQRVVSFLGIIFCALALFVPAAANPYSRGPQYTITQSPEHKQPYIEVRNATYHGSGPREEARAMCSVKTQEVNATANATITRRLHGVVTSRELHSSIQRLEVIIYGQMQQLWQSLDALRSQIAGAPRVSFPDRRSTVQKDWRRKKSMKSIDPKAWVPHVLGSIDKYLLSQAAADCNI